MCLSNQRSCPHSVESVRVSVTAVMDTVERTPRRTKLGRKLSRRLSLVTKVPNMITVRLSASRDSLRSRHRNFEITTIAPDKTQRIVSTAVEPVCLRLSRTGN
jgi:hypothetical protein